MFVKNSVITIISLFLFFNTACFGIVNMDALHFDEDQKTGFSGDVELLFSGTSGNTDTKRAMMNAQVNWKQPDSINLVIMGYAEGESNNQKNVNNSFAHYRHIHKYTSRIDWEAFTQIEQNEFTRLSYRGLIGAGGRFQFSHTKVHKAYIGLGAFYAKEKIAYRVGLTDDGTKTSTRANMYILSRYKTTDTLTFSNALYYQPRLNKTSDYRALLQSKFDFAINKSLSFRVSLDVAHDSQPSQTIEQTDVSYNTGLNYRF